MFENIAVDESWYYQLNDQIAEMVKWMDENFPYIPGYQVRYDTSLDSSDFSENNMTFRAYNFRYEPIIYFDED